MDMKNLIKEVDKEEDVLSKISFSIGWLKGESEKKDNEKQFSANEVIELLKSIRNS